MKPKNIGGPDKPLAGKEGARESGVGFSTPEVARITGIKFRTIDSWSRQGILTPSIAEAHGIGSERRYSEVDLLALAAIAAVPSNSAEVRKAIVREVREHPESELANVSISPNVAIWISLKALRRAISSMPPSPVAGRKHATPSEEGGSTS